MAAHPPSLEDIHAAQQRIAFAARVTPLVEDEVINDRVGGRLFLKAECLQRGGAFKARGALNKLGILKAAGHRGVVGFSSGNHAIAVALSARLYGMQAKIVMPADAPAAKLDETRRQGADVITYDRVREDREAIARAIAAEHGWPVCPPFDDADVIAGQGTCALEIVASLKALGVAPDIALVCASGGGLAAGVALALHADYPKAEVYPVEPEGHDDIAQSLKAGRRVANAPGVRSIADALMAQEMGVLPFEVAQTHFAGALAVSDAEIKAAMAMAFHRLKLVVEPGGAAALAAALSGKIDLQGKTAVAILSGGNVDPALFAEAISA